MALCTASARADWPLPSDRGSCGRLEGVLGLPKESEVNDVSKGMSGCTDDVETAAVVT